MTSAATTAVHTVATPQGAAPGGAARDDARGTLAAALLGFFVVTLDAVVVNVAMPTVRTDLGGGITGLQATGVVFLPMMLIGLLLTPFSARLVERVGHRTPIVAGLVVMAAGSLTLALVAASAPVGVLSALLVLVGLGGPLVMPPTTGVLLNGVPAATAGTASGVFNTSRQLGGALAVAVFGGLLAGHGGFHAGVRDSLLIAAVVVLLAAPAACRLPTGTGAEEQR